jgi:hypothetical protein
MAETNVATPAAAPAVNPLKPAPQSADSGQKVQPTSPPAEANGSIQQTGEQEKVHKDQERRAAAIAKAKRVEAQVFQEREKLKQEREQWKREQDKAIAAMKTLEEGQRLRSDPKKFLEWAGINPTDIVKQVARGDQRKPEEIVAQEIAKLEAKMRAERQEMDAKTQKEQQEKIKKNFEEQNYSTLQGMIDADKEKFECCAAEGTGPKLAWELIEQTYDRYADPTTGKLKASTPKEIADLFTPFNQTQLFTFALEAVESDLEEKSFTRYSSSKKIQARLKAAEQAAKEKLEKDAAAQVASRTKTGFAKPQSSSTPTDAASKVRNRVQSPQDRRARIRALIEAQKTQQ